MLNGKWKNGARFGHIDIVYKESSKRNVSTNQYIYDTKTFDAWVSDVPLSQQVAPRDMADYWANSRVRNRRIVRYGGSPYRPPTTWQKNQIISFHEEQQGKPYSIYTSLSDNDKWYCSKLVYRAYLSAGINLVDNPGRYITPSDIANSWKVYSIAFGLT